MCSVNDRCRPMVETARQVLAACGDEVVTAFVFGSVAWGDADESSDVDMMLLLERDDDFREVRRIRVSDLIDDPGPGPAFADIDRMSFNRFSAAVAKDQWLHRAVNSVVLVDDGRYQPVRDRATARLADPGVRAALADHRAQEAEAQRTAAEGLADSDLSLAILHARIAAEEAGAALLLAGGNRVSVAHFFGGLRTTMSGVGQAGLVDRLQTALAVDGGATDGSQGLQSYRRIAERLRQWMADPQTIEALGPEHVAWAEFTYSQETYDEFDHKTTALKRADREAEMVLYVDGLFKVPLRINAGKVLRLRTGGGTERMSIPEFHLALRTEPELHREWVTGLRLDGDVDDVTAATDVASEMLANLDGVLAHSKVAFR